MVFVNECCTPLDAKPPVNGADPKVLPENLGSLLSARHASAAGGGLAGPLFASRAKMREKDAADDAEDRTKEPPLLTPDKAAYLQRQKVKDQIKYLKFLSKSPLTSDVDRVKHALALFNLMQQLAAADSPTLVKQENDERETLETESTRSQLFFFAEVRCTPKR